eukprot:3393426-Alexandrium_andersonii.AAC.1
MCIRDSPQGRVASERPRSTPPKYYLVHPHVTARLPPVGAVPAFDNEAYGSPEVWGTRAQRSLFY